jgi:hypothetical protein
MTLDRRRLLALGASAAFISGAARAAEEPARAGLTAILSETGVPALAGAVVTPDGLPFLSRRPACGAPTGPTG